MRPNLKYLIKAKGDWLKINDCKLHVGNRMWSHVFYMLKFLENIKLLPIWLIRQRAFCLRTQKWMLFYFCRGQTVPACYQYHFENRRENNIKWCHSSLYSLLRNTMGDLFVVLIKVWNMERLLDFIMDCRFLVLWHHLLGDNRSR